MPGLRPTLVIGLGSTGLHVIDYLRNFLLEEYGEEEIPCLQFLPFETDASKKSQTGVSVKPLTIPSTDAVRRVINTPLGQETTKAEGYRQWLPMDILNLGDSFTAGAGSVRPAGRLILWENWETAKDEISQALYRCSFPPNTNRSVEILTQHYAANGISYAPPVVDTTEPPMIYIVGTLCGGSCSGMFADFGFLLRTIKDSPRVLVATMLSAGEASKEKNRILAANCCGALKELDFYFQQLPEGSWSYVLPDRTEVKPTHEPYSLVYLVSQSNGNTDLVDESALNQMVSMNLFLDIVGQGYTVKNAAIKDLQMYMATRNRDTEGFVRYFFSFGLSAVWYPKFKITGIAACDLGTELCDRWLGKKNDPAAERITHDVEKDFTEIDKWIEQEVAKDLDKVIGSLQGNDMSEIVRNMGRRPTEILQEKTGEVLAAARQTEGRLKDIAVTAGDKLWQKFNSRFFDDYRDCTRTDLWWQGVQGLVKGMKDMMKTGIEKGKGEEPAPGDLNLQVSSGTLNSLIKSANRAAKDIWVRMVFQRKAAVRYYRERFVRQQLREWEARLDEFKKSRKRVVYRILRCAEEDQGVFATFCKGIPPKSRWKEIDSQILNVMAKMREVRGKMEKQRVEFASLGGSQVVHQVFMNGSVENDAFQNRSTIKENNLAPLEAVSVAWHLDAIKNDARDIRSERDFWQRLTSAEIASLAQTNYQREGLKHLPDNQADASDADLVSLAGHAIPYQEINKALFAGIYLGELI